MTPADDPIAVADEQIALWKGNRVKPATAWLALTGREMRERSWRQVHAWMIRWLLRNDDIWHRDQRPRTLFKDYAPAKSRAGSA